MESGVRWSLLVCVFVLFVRLSHGTANFVTCGSVLKLQHVKLGVRLHSHEVNYGSGSGQQVSVCVCACVCGGGVGGWGGHVRNARLLSTYVVSRPFCSGSEEAAYAPDGRKQDLIKLSTPTPTPFQMWCSTECSQWKGLVPFAHCTLNHSSKYAYKRAVLEQQILRMPSKLAPQFLFTVCANRISNLETTVHLYGLL